MQQVDVSVHFLEVAFWVHDTSGHRRNWGMLHWTECFFTIALEEVGSVNVTIQFVSKKENVYTMPERISPWDIQQTGGKWTVLVPWLYLQENSKPMTGTDSGLGVVYQVSNTVKGLKQMVLHQFVLPSDTFSDQGHHLIVHFVQYRPNTECGGDSINVCWWMKRWMKDWITDWSDGIKTQSKSDEGVWNEWMKERDIVEKHCTYS